MIEILNELSQQKPYLIIYKKTNLPSAPLSADDFNNAFSIAAKQFPQLLEVKGQKEIEHGLLHRLDNVTEGLLLIAASQEFYDYMIEQQKEGKFIKTYKAQCKLNRKNADVLGAFPLDEKFNFNKGEEITVHSMFRPFGKGSKEVRPVTEKSGEAALKKVGKKVVYSTKIKITDVNDDIIDVECKINAGFRHQIRCHLAWIGLPIINDPLYNCECIGNYDNQIRFAACGLDFYYPKGDLNSYVRKYTWT